MRAKKIYNIFLTADKYKNSNSLNQGRAVHERGHFYAAIENTNLVVQQGEMLEGRLDVYIRHSGD